MRRFPAFLCVLGLMGSGALHGEDVVIYRPQLDDDAPLPRAAAASDPAPVPESAAATHTVAKGETFFSIARKYQIPVASLKEANHFTGRVSLHVGEVLQLPSAPAVAVAVASTPNALPTTTQLAYQKKFIQETRRIAAQGVAYDARWVPAGIDAAHAWAMDCSNTARYLYKKVAGVDLPRTASDQYEALKEKGLTWSAPRELDALEAKLEVGDLLFWENTYNAHRDPPVTHVMIYLGKNTKGEWLMAGSQQGSGFYNVSGSGPDIYVFRPDRTKGGYSTNLGFTHVAGRFTSYGRPLLQKDGAAGAELAER